jgi:hypothetical protein
MQEERGGHLEALKCSNKEFLGPSANTGKAIAIDVCEAETKAVNRKNSIF